MVCLLTSKNVSHCRKNSESILTMNEEEQKKIIAIIALIIMALVGYSLHLIETGVG